jgi:hypothetical protein
MLDKTKENKMRKPPTPYLNSLLDYHNLSFIGKKAKELKECKQFTNKEVLAEIGHCILKEAFCISKYHQRKNHE